MCHRRGCLQLANARPDPSRASRAVRTTVALRRPMSRTIFALR